MGNSLRALYLSALIAALPMLSFARSGIVDTLRVPKVLYVATTGNDAVTYAANDLTHPWLTFDKALKNVKTGDSVFFRAGNYPVAAIIDMHTIGADGTASKRITFLPYKSETVTITGGTGVDPLVKLENNFVTVYGMSFVGDGNGFFLGEDAPANNFILRRCSYKMRVGGDNKGFIHGYGNNSLNAIVDRCVIVGPGLYSKGVHGNTAGIIVFQTEGVKLLNNDISNVPIGIYYKHANIQSKVNPGIEIAYNYIHGTDRFAMMLNCNHATIHDNLFGASNAPIETNEANGVPGGDGNIFSHNTFYGGVLELLYDTSPGDSVPGAIGNILRNNIFIKETGAHRYASVSHKTTSDYNYYPVGNIFAENRAYYTLNTWRTKAKTDTHSVSSAVSFIGGAAPTSIAGFVLAGTSPGRKAGSDGLDIGANILKVGPDSLKATTIEYLRNGIESKKQNGGSSDVRFMSIRKNMSVFNAMPLSKPLYNILGRSFERSQAESSMAPIGTTMLLVVPE